MSNNSEIDTQRLDTEAGFKQLLKTARRIAEINPRGLSDLVRAILRPLQSEYLLGVAERGQDAFENIESMWFFGEAIRDRLFSADGMSWRGESLPSQSFLIKLASHIVLPWPWSMNSYVSAIATIGSGKTSHNRQEASRRCLRESQGAWVQDDNHRIELWLPWGIGFVNGGNHSITAGVLAGEGEVIPDKVYDMSFLLDDLHCDGRFFYDTNTGLVASAVKDARRAAVFEIGRMMREFDCPAFNCT